MKKNKKSSGNDTLTPQSSSSKQNEENNIAPVKEAVDVQAASSKPAENADAAKDASNAQVALSDKVEKSTSAKNDSDIKKAAPKKEEQDAAHSEKGRRYADKTSGKTNANIKHTADCPGCGFTLEYSESKPFINCSYCGKKLSTADLKAGLLTSKRSASSAQSTEVVASSYAMSIDNPESALVYIENFFESYNWDSYNLTSSLDVFEIKDMVEKTKIRYGATAEAWILDFESKITPLTKKLIGLYEQEKEFLKYHEIEDKAVFMQKYDLYEKITTAIKDSAEELFAAMQSDIEYAESFGADEDILKSMKERFNETVELYNENVHDFSKIDEIPAVKEAIAISKALAAEKLADEGIDAEATYQKAVHLYNTCDDKQDALRLFEIVKEYGDAAKYIEKINKFFIFDDKVIKLANKHFLLKLVKPRVFDVKNPEDVSDDDDTYNASYKSSEPTFSLYEVIDGAAYKPAAVTGISCALSFYGNKIFYIKRNRSIASYDVLTRMETELDRGSIDDYPLIRNYTAQSDDEEDKSYDKSNNILKRCLISRDKKFLFLKKKLSPFETKKKGCFKAFFSIFKRKKPQFTDDKNNYEVIKVDMVNNVATTVIDRVVDITECFDDRIFYIAYQAPIIQKTRTLDPFPSFMLCDLKTGKKTEILGDDCHIHNVIGDIIIYTTWDPNQYNQMLFAYNIKTDVTTLVEANIFRYLVTINEKLYYSVGNEIHNVLFSNNIDGTERVEIMKNVDQIYDVIHSWIYLIRGTGANRVLFKMNPDTKEIYMICAHVCAIIKISDTHTYYLDFDNVLHSVRNDGKNDIELIEDIYKPYSTIFDNNSIYYMRREKVKDNRESASLYRMDLDGSNIKKLIFNVESIEGYDENYIYVYKCDTVKYIRRKLENFDEKSRKWVKFGVSDFSIFNKNTETEIPLLSIGRPDDESLIEKKGCFRKKIKHSTTYEEISNKIPYKKKGLAKVGEIYAEQTSFDTIQ